MHGRDEREFSALTSLWALFVLTLRQHLHGKRWMVMTALFLLPAALAILIRIVSPDVPAIWIEFLLGFMLIPQALLPLIALVYASGIIQDEQEDQTLTYLLMRPIPKWAVYAVKLAATLIVAVGLTVLFTIVTYLAVFVGGKTSFVETASRCAKAAGIHALAVASYSCLFGLLSLLTKRTLIVGILYSALVEGLLANLPFGIRFVTVIYYTRLIAFRALPFVVDTPGVGQVDVSAVAWQFDVQKDPSLAAHPSLRMCILILAGASIACTVIASFLCARREFRVKTPEGS